MSDASGPNYAHIFYSSITLVLLAWGSTRVALKYKYGFSFELIDVLIMQWLGGLLPL